MKKYNPLYYLLFILLIMGAFASMAQNSYGLKLMGGVAFVFGLLFLRQLYTAVKKKGGKNLMEIAELTGLFLLSVILGLRIFYIHFMYVEVLFAVAGLLLLSVYLQKMIVRYRLLQPKNNLLAILILIFHFSIILFIISLVLVPFAPTPGEYAGTGAFALLLLFLIIAFYKRKLLVDGENVSAIKWVTRFKDHSIVIVSLFLLLTLYVGFNRIGVLPGIYADQFPQAYYKLVNDAVSRKEKPVDGRYKHEEFKKKYDQFVERNGIRHK
jgi:hypothetical protein